MFVDNKKDSSFHIRCTKEQKKIATDMAKTKGMTLSEYFMYLLDSEYKKN